MKRIIDGLIYNTATAAEIASSTRHSPTDFNHVAEALYRTRNGRYFLAGEGNARSRYAEQVDQNTWGPGAGIIPLDAAEALRWCEDCGVDTDTIEAEFAGAIHEA